MEQKHRATTLSIAKRYLMRKWRVPFQVLGGAALLVAVSGFVPVKVRPVKKVDPPREVVTSGVVESLAVKSVGSKFDGSILAVPVRQGQPVKKGQLLFTMDARGLESQLAGAKIARAQAATAAQQAREGMKHDLAVIRQQASALAAELKRERATARAWKQQAAAVVPTGDGFVEEAPVVVAEPVPYDTGRMQELERRLHEVRALVAERRRTWAPVIQDAERDLAQASADVSRLQGLIASAKRTSPIDGVVTGVYFQGGEYVPAGQPIVRVDNPEGYRVVTLVNQSLSEPLKPGTEVPVRREGATEPAKLEKIVPGEEKVLFNDYVWLKPQDPAAFWPGQKVDTIIPAAVTVTSK